jgi:hypothetical protein
MSGLAQALFVLAGILLVLGIMTLVLSPLMAARVAAGTTRPKLERRGTGHDRMSAIIQAQLTERSRRSSLAVGLVRTGVGLAIGAILLLVGGVAVLLGGF